MVARLIGSLAQSGLFGGRGSAARGGNPIGHRVAFARRLAFSQSASALGYRCHGTGLAVASHSTRLPSFVISRLMSAAVHGRTASERQVGD